MKIVTIIWILGAALPGLALGVYSVREGLVRLRRPLQRPDALSVWEEPPLSTWQEEALIAMAMSTTTMGLLVLGVLVGLDGIRHWSASWAWLTTGLSLVRHASILLSVWLVWYFIGAQLGFSLFNRLIRPLRKGIAPGGVFSGQFYFPWSLCSHYLADESGGMIRIYGQSSPEVPIIVFKPGNHELFQQLKLAVAAQIPDSPMAENIPWRRRKATLVVGLAALSILPMLGGLWLYRQQFFMAWAFQAILAWFVLTFSARLLQSFTGIRSTGLETASGS